MMAFSTPFHQAGAALQSQLTSFTGTSSMLEKTTNDSSYSAFVAAVDDAFKTPTQSNRRNSPQTMGSSFCDTFQDSLHLVNSGQSPQPSPDLSFPGALGPTGSSPDWPQQHPSAANDSSRFFSSSCQGYDPGHIRRPHSATPTQITTCYTSQQPCEHTSHELRHHFPYSDERNAPLYQEDSLSPQIFAGNGFSRVPVTLPYNYSSHLPASSLSQSGSRVHSRQSSHGSTPTVIFPGIENMDDMGPDLSTLNSPDSVRQNLISVGSAAFQFPNDMQSSPSLEMSKSYTSSDTASSIVTLPSIEKNSRLSQVSGTGTPRSRRLTGPSLAGFENLGSVPLGRSLSARSSKSRSSNGQSRLLPKPRQNVTEGTQRNSVIRQGIKLPRKSRGKRTKPLEDDKRQAATRRRNERTVCIGCKMAKVMCEGREDGGDCSRCTSSHSNAPKPFVCVPASFFELVQQGSTVLLALHTFYSFSSGVLRPAIGLPFDIDIRQLLGSLTVLQRSTNVIRAYEGNNMLYELDLHACWTYVNANYSPTSHPFQQFINGLKIQRQDGWKRCIKDGTNQLSNKENLCEALFAWDDTTPYVTYVIVHKANHESVFALDLYNEQHKQFIIVAAQLYRIIGRQLELQFYDYLKKVLANPSICRKLVLDVGRAIVSLRRRLALWTRHWGPVQPATAFGMEAYADRDSGSIYSLPSVSNDARRVKHLCLILYVYFCYMRRRLPAEEQEGLHVMEVWDSESQQLVKENLPQYESIGGFEEWVQSIDQ